MSKIEIVRAEKKDAELIAIISRETFYDTYSEQNTDANMAKFLTKQLGKAMLMDEVGAPGNNFYLAYLDGEVAGYIKLKESDHPQLPKEKSLEISRIYIYKSFIGKSVGTALLQAAIKFAKEINKEWVWLIAWKENKRAIGFYEANGFEIFAESEFLLGDDLQFDWVFKKCIQ